MSTGHGFIFELRRRHVVRVGLAYAVAGWVILQLASIVLPALGAPDWVLRVAITFLALGFPFALILAWAFELTPDGIRRTEPADSPAARASDEHRRVGRGLNALVIAALLLAVAVLGWRQFSTRGTQPAAGAPAAAVPAPGAPVAGKSIAVLPFESLSEDKANAYFATGMQDEILTRLANIRDLKVISRTSTERYASHPPDLRTVGLQLGVAAVLEGTVQKAGDAAHINLQLIDTQTDGHLWAESYDRELKDIFAVERDVAEKVAGALKATLMPEEAARVAAAPTRDAEAYDLYLRALVDYNRSNDQYGLSAALMPNAIALLERALEKDPDFAEAAAALARSQMYMYFFGGDRSPGRLTAAKAAADRALSLRPDLGSGHVALAFYWYWGFKDYDQALAELRVAIKTMPSDAQVQILIGAIARRQGKWDEAIAGFRQAAKFDPRNSSPPFEIGQTHAYERRYAEADQAFVHATELTGDPVLEQIRRGQNNVHWKGDLALLRDAVNALVANTAPYNATGYQRFMLRWWSRDYAAALREIDGSAVREWSDLNNLVTPIELYVGWAQEALGDREKARAAYVALGDRARASLKIQPDDPNWHVALAFALAGAGSKDEAIAHGRRAVELLPVTRDALSGPAYPTRLAQLYVRLGENEKAIDELRELLAIPAGTVMSVALLRLDPVWDPLRKDPRFLALVAEGDHVAKEAH